MGGAHHQRGYAAVATAVGGGHPRYEGVWDCCTRRCGACVGLGARTLHETGNWLVFTACSNAFNTLKILAMLVEVVNGVSAPTPSMTKCYGARPADVLFRVDSEETMTIACSTGDQQGDPMGPATFCLALRSKLKRSRAEFEGEGVKTFAYM